MWSNICVKINVMDVKTKLNLINNKAFYFKMADGTNGQLQMEDNNQMYPFNLYYFN